MMRPFPSICQGAAFFFYENTGVLPVKWTMNNNKF